MVESQWPPFSSRHFQIHFMDQNFRFSIRILSKFVHRGQITIRQQKHAFAPSNHLNQCWPCRPTYLCFNRPQCVNTLRPIQSGRHFSCDVFKRTLLKENVWISLTNNFTEVCSQGSSLQYCSIDSDNCLAPFRKNNSQEQRCNNTILLQNISRIVSCILDTWA